MRAVIIITSTLFILFGCDNLTQQNYSTLEAPRYSAEENYPGGETSVSYQPFASLQLPAENLAHELRPNFHAGKALANQPWVKAPTITTAS